VVSTEFSGKSRFKLIHSVDARFASVIYHKGMAIVHLGISLDV